MAPWRVARSLVKLTDEVRSIWPRTTVWTIGNEEHQAEDSDHNPNQRGVVCAADFLGNDGMSLGLFARTITEADPPALKYAIYNRRIWFPGYGWQGYRGSNPHLAHVHVSVGWGPDGQSTGPYDDESSWGVSAMSGEQLDRLVYLAELDERRGKDWHLQNQGVNPRNTGEVYGWTQLRAELESLQNSIPTATAIVSAMAENPQILSALTSAMRDQLPLIPTAQEIAKAFIDMISGNVRESRNGTEG